MFVKLSYALCINSRRAPITPLYRMLAESDDSSADNINLVRVDSAIAKNSCNLQV